MSTITVILIICLFILIILSGRSLNDAMPNNVFKDIMRIIKEKKMNIKNNLNVLIMGLTFKENCPDTRNSKILEFSQ